MKKLDYYLLNRRQAIVEPHIPNGCEVLDIGGFDGSFLTKMGKKIARGVCMDPCINENSRNGNIQLIKSAFAGKLSFAAASFDVVSLLAVFEHLGEYQYALVPEIYRVLKPGGIVVMTVPSSAVDHILKILVQLRLLDGMDLEQHSHRSNSVIIRLFSESGFTLKHWKKFQLGLNNMFVFSKPSVE